MSFEVQSPCRNRLTYKITNSRYKLTANNQIIVLETASDDLHDRIRVGNIYDSQDARRNQSIQIASLSQTICSVFTVSTKKKIISAKNVNFTTIDAKQEKKTCKHTQTVLVLYICK